MTRGGITVDRVRFTASAGALHVEMTPKPFRVLVALMERSPDIVPGEVLWQNAWPKMIYNKCSNGSLRMAVTTIQRYLNRLGVDGRALVRCRHAEGYQFVPPLGSD